MTIFTPGDRVYAVHPPTGKVHDDKPAGTVVRVETGQTSLPLVFVHWDDEAEDVVPVWFRSNELSKVEGEAVAYADSPADEDRRNLADLESIILDLTDYIEHDNDEVERLRVLHRRLKAQFPQRYDGERP